MMRSVLLVGVDRGSRLVAVFAMALFFSMVGGGHLRADTISLYATSVPDNPAWTNESYAEGNPGNLDCNGVPEQYSYIDTGGTFLRATAFDAPPANMDHYRIIRVVVEALCRYDSGTEANIRAEVDLGNGYSPLDASNTWASDPNLCSWRLTTVGDITGRLSRPWTAADLGRIRFGVAKQLGVTATLRVKAFRINVTRELIDCDGDGVYDGDDPLTRPELLGPWSVSTCPGQRAALAVVATSQTPVTCTWRRGGAIYTGSSFQNGNTCYLVNIVAAVTENDIPFTCTVVNACGSTESSPAFVRACVADCNCDGTISVEDIFCYLADWFAAHPRADVNGLPGVSVDDIFHFVEHWFGGC